VNSTGARAYSCVLIKPTGEIGATFATKLK